MGEGARRSRGQASPGRAARAAARCTRRPSARRRRRDRAAARSRARARRSAASVGASPRDGLDDRLQRFGQVAVVVDRVDDGARRSRARRPAAARARAATARWSRSVASRFVRRARARRRRPDQGVSDSAALGSVQSSPISTTGSSPSPPPRRCPSRLGARRRLSRRPGRLEVLVGLEHHVGLERLQHLRLQLERRQLQQPDGLLQLRRHRQLLAEPELQAGLHHARNRGGRIPGGRASWRCAVQPLKGSVPFMRSEPEILPQVDLAHLGVCKDLVRRIRRPGRCPG